MQCPIGYSFAPTINKIYDVDDFIKHSDLDIINF